MTQHLLQGDLGTLARSLMPRTRRLHVADGGGPEFSYVDAIQDPRVVQNFGLIVTLVPKHHEMSLKNGFENSASGFQEGDNR